MHSPSVPDQGVNPGRVRVPAVVRSGAAKRGAVEGGVPAMRLNFRAQFPGETNGEFILILVCAVGLRRRVLFTALADPGGEDQNREGRQGQSKADGLDP